MATDPYANLTRDQRRLLNRVQAEAFETYQDVGDVLANVTAAPEDKRAVSDALAAAGR